MSSDDAWSAEWCCEKLISHDKIIEVTKITSNSIRLLVQNMHRHVLVATMSSRCVELSSIPEEARNQETEFLLNIPKDAYFSGELLSFSENASFGFGGLGDLYTAVNEQEFRNYLPKETRFLVRALEQHSAVRAIIRTNNRTYQFLNTLVTKLLSWR